LGVESLFEKTKIQMATRSQEANALFHAPRRFVLKWSHEAKTPAALELEATPVNQSSPLSPGIHQPTT
jgi:hypothetical protein